MKYKQLGRTGVRVSAIAIGTATLGVAPLEKDADRVIGRAIDLGVNVIDCANSYGNQSRFDRPNAPPASERASAEEIVGKVVKGKRDQVLLCSKVMEPVGEGQNDWGLSRRHIFQQVERSLKRLGTDHIDVYYAHHPDATTPLEETLRAFDDLVRQGKIRYGALSTYPAADVVEAMWIAKSMGAQPPACLQVYYNLAKRDLELDLAPVAERYGLSMTVFSPLMGGLLAGAANRQFSGHQRWGGPGFSAAQLAVGAELDALAQQSGHKSAHLALAWLTSKPYVGSAIIGPETVEELEENVAAMDLDLSPDLLAAIDAINKPSMSWW